jgi:hypothetical protein
MVTAAARVSGRALPSGGLGWRRVDGRTAAVAASVFIVCVALGAGVSLVLPEDMNGKAALIGAFVACAVAALGPILFLGRGAAREPIVYYPILAFVDLAGSSLAWLGEPQSSIALVRADFTKALLLVAAGFAALWVGWFATRGPRATRAHPGFAPSELPSRRLTVALAGVGSFSVLVLLATGSFGFLRAYETFGELGAWTEWVVATRGALDVALAFAAFRAFGMRDRARARPDLVLLVALLALQFGVGLLHGTKVNYILPRVLVVVFIFALFNRRLPIKWALACIIGILLTFPIIERYRELSFRPDASPNEETLVIGGVRETMRDIDGSVKLALDKLNSRLRQIENVAAVLRDTPSVYPYTNGSALPEGIAIAFIPRIVWPDKPVLDTATTFPQLYLKQAITSRSGTGPSHFGDLYRNFGLLGVILGMGLFGTLFAGLGRLTERGGLRTLFIVAFTLTVLTRVEDALVETLVAFTHVMAPVFVAALFLPRSAPHDSAARLKQ